MVKQKQEYRLPGNVFHYGRNYQRVWYNQPKPYREPLDYIHNYWEPKFPGYETSWPGNAYAIGSIYAQRQDIGSFPALYARAFDRFRAKCGDQAGLAINLLELPKSIEMITTRGRQLRQAFQSLRKGDIMGLSRNLAVHPSDVRSRGITRNKMVNNVSGSWLELQFGWLPMIGDIHTACKILQRDFPLNPVRASAFDIGAFPVYGGTITLKESIVLKGSLRVKNPGLFLANQLGLINPAVVAWDAVPFSFVVDWFLPVNKFLNSLTNDFGIEIMWPQKTTKRTFFANSKDGYYQNGEYVGQFPSSVTGGCFVREVGAFPIPGFLDRLHVPQIQPWLAATSISLLVQQLRLR